MSIVCSAALKAHLALGGRSSQTVCTMWLAKQKNGDVLGYTEHSEDLQFNLEAWMASVGLGNIPAVRNTGTVNYSSSAGHVRTDIATTAALDVDNLQAQGPLRLPSLVRADVQAGLWDAASFILFLINYSDPGMGALIYRVGMLGEITIGRGSYQADLLGVALAYAKQIGNLTSPGCRYNLGDQFCTIDLAGGQSAGSPSFALTVTGTLTGVGTGSMPRVLYDTARTEPGPSGSPTGDISGFFDNGIFRFDSGQNAGLEMEIQLYAPGEFLLELPMPYPVVGNENYTAIAGCKKAYVNDCILKFNNGINFGGEPELPGTDKLLEVGKQ